MGSRFSPLQTAMQLLSASRTTSYSSSFQPFGFLSPMTCGWFTSAVCTRACSSCSSAAKPLLGPPRAKAARAKIGWPILRAARAASSTELHQELSGTL